MNRRRFLRLLGLAPVVAVVPVAEAASRTVNVDARGSQVGETQVRGIIASALQDHRENLKKNLEEACKRRQEFFRLQDGETVIRRHELLRG